MARDIAVTIAHFDITTGRYRLEERTVERENLTNNPKYRTGIIEHRRIRPRWGCRKQAETRGSSRRSSSGN